MVPIGSMYFKYILFGCLCHVVKMPTGAGARISRPGCAKMGVAKGAGVYFQ